MGYKEENLKKAQDDSNKFKDGDATVKMDRSCTDILCCFVFLAFIIGMVILSVFGFQQGDPMRILTPFDSKGNRCGFKNETTGVNMEEYPYKYFTMVSGEVSADYSNSICVKSCPEKGTKPQCLSGVHGCNAEGGFTAAIYPSKPQLGKYCIPYGDEVKDTFNKIYN